MFELLLPGDVARQYESRILEVAPSRLRIVLDPDVSRAEIAVTGSYDRPFEEIVADMPSLRWIHSTSAGIDALHSPEIEARGLLLTSSAGVYAPAMAEYAITAMVLLARGWSTWLESQRERCWPDRSSSGTNLRGKVLGIVGYGGVGRRLALAAKALGMTVLATRRTPLVTSAEPLDVLLPPEALSRLLADSDFVVVSASLNSSTKGLIGDRELRTMKQGAFLINLSRGALIDQDALVQALTDRRIGGAVIDVANPEPLPSDSPLWNAPNLWITPHVAGDTVEGRQAAIDLLCENLRFYVRGEADRMTNLVDVRAHR
ncbi:MAG: D-2-hydroxyacid dehydrogenase [Actinobacteria bacterium]|nr:MAG: D-2-hydroxyacid dehydrogenase [Actinomycetota bacterium]